MDIDWGKLTTTLTTVAFFSVLFFTRRSMPAGAQVEHGQIKNSWLAASTIFILSIMAVAFGSIIIYFLIAELDYMGGLGSKVLTVLGGVFFMLIGLWLAILAMGMMSDECDLIWSDSYIEGVYRQFPKVKIQWPLPSVFYNRAKIKWTDITIIEIQGKKSLHIEDMKGNKIDVLPFYLGLDIFLTAIMKYRPDLYRKHHLGWH